MTGFLSHPMRFFGDRSWRVFGPRRCAQPCPSLDKTETGADPILRFHLSQTASVFLHCESAGGKDRGWVHDFENLTGGRAASGRSAEPRHSGLASRIYGGRSSIGLVVFVAVLTGVICASTFAQSQKSAPSARVPLARYVPASAKLFVAVRGLGEVNDALDRAHAWQLLSLFSGVPTTETGKPFNLREAIVNFLGPHASIDVDELLRLDAGLVATSWSALGSAVWLVRTTDDTTLDRWFPPEGRVGAAAMRELRCFRTRDGMIVCSRDKAIAMSRRWTDNSPMREILSVMGGGAKDVLDGSDTFRDLMAYLPPDYLAVAYWATDGPAAQHQNTPSPWWPTLDRGVLALYEGEGRIDVAIRASLAAPHQKPRLSPAAVDRLLRLPRTTLYATTTTVELGDAYVAATTGRPSGVLARYLTLLSGIQRGITVSAEVEPRFGPHVNFVWGQDLSEDGSSPHVAAMIECSDVTTAREYARKFAGRLMRLFRLVDSTEPSDDLRIQETRHLGVPISYVTLAARAGVTRLPPVKLLAGLEPAWAVWDGWLIVALHRAHIEHILDAQFGLTPTLAGVRDVSDLQRQSTAWGVLSVAQASLAADVLDRWLEAYEAGSPSLLDPSWWTRRRPAATRHRLQLGISMKIVQEPGVVVVTRVHPRTPAMGHLIARDRVVGIDGQLLSLHSPNSDLRKRWSESKAEPGPVLRLQRDGTIKDVVVPKKIDLTTDSEIMVNPADAVRELAALAKTLQFASFAVHASDEQHYSARLSLRFAPAHVTNASGER